MKKLLLNSAALLFVGVLAAQAQTPSTPTTPTPSTTTPTEEQQRPRSGDWAKVESSQLPAPVQQTLRTDKYKGWENDGVYFNKSTNQYSVDIRTGATPGLYYFDQSGRTVTGVNPSSPQQGTTGSATRPNPTPPNNSSGSTVPPKTPEQSPTPNR